MQFGRDAFWLAIDDELWNELVPNDKIAYS
eukprot:SAG31_NODE_24680_length_476_cov_1.185676_1_plen_29_part_10